MSWEVRYHSEVADDLEAIGPSQAARAMRVIDARLHLGEPDKSGKPLGGDLAGCRRIRAGDMRVIYRLNPGRKEVVVLAVGPRRHEEAYRKAGRRT